MTIPNRSKIGPAATRVMLTILDLDGRKPTIELDDIAEALGLNKCTVQRHLVHLRQAGLVTWVDGQNGTLRPAAALVPIGEVA